MRYTVVALVALLLAGCGGGGGSRPGTSYSPAAQARTVSADVSRPLTAADCTRQLQEEAGRRGKDWLRKFVKVHVNIMNPMDFSYRTSRLVSHLPIAPDTMISGTSLPFANSTSSAAGAPKHGML